MAVFCNVFPGSLPSVWFPLLLQMVPGFRVPVVFGVGMGNAVDLPVLSLYLLSLLISPFGFNVGCVFSDFLCGRSHHLWRRMLLLSFYRVNHSFLLLAMLCEPGPPAPW